MNLIWISLITILCASTLVKQCDGKTISLPGKITGGEDAQIQDYPYQVSIEFARSHQCGGTIIAADVILTAGHCTAFYNEKYLQIRAGTSYRETGGVVRQVAKKIIHEEFNVIPKDYDVSLIILNETLEFSQFIQPIQLPEENEFLTEDHVGIVTGWGRLTHEGPQPDILQKVEIPIVNQNACINAYVNDTVTPRMLCAGDLTYGGKDACQGDSGGPLVVNHKIHGISSWGDDCGAKQFPGVYTRVSAVREWIRSQINV
ncbi:vitellin-degrading protease-like [Chrysoperla carnea]|uniref:vitellin-degrading protease-like n=1 Tax=Chrysoperla carnea TaxID=189513 RepID=UPI001D08966F|nr:vitellin-degrading protease-like [Chrysoperla carnea]